MPSQLPDGQSAKEICFIDDMLFVPHFLNLLAGGNIHALVKYGEAAPDGSDRKEIAKHLHNQVSHMATEHRRREYIGEGDEAVLTLPAVSPG